MADRQFDQITTMLKEVTGSIKALIHSTTLSTDRLVASIDAGFRMLTPAAHLNQEVVEVHQELLNRSRHPPVAQDINMTNPDNSLEDEAMDTVIPRLAPTSGSHGGI